MASAASAPASSSSPPQPSACAGTPKYLSTQPLASSHNPAHSPSSSASSSSSSAAAGSRSTARAAGSAPSGLPPPPPSLRHLSPSMIAGAGAGLVSSIVTCPLDVVKTRMQAQTKGKGKAVAYDGALTTFNKIFREAGLKGFYRGLGPTIIGYLPTWSIFFSVYDVVKQELGERSLAASSTGGVNIPAESNWAHILAAMTAGATGTIVTNPLWVIKTRFMAQSLSDVSAGKRYRNTWDAIRTIYSQEGGRAFYRGLMPSLLGVSHVAVQFPLYEQLKIWSNKGDGTPLSSGVILLCSATSKMVASFTTYPHEVVRTRLQVQRIQLQRPPSSTPTPSPSPSSSAPRPPPLEPPIAAPAAPAPAAAAYRGLGKTVAEILREAGWRGFYRGLGVNLVRTVPNSAVTMLTYELIMRYLTQDRSLDD